MGFLAGVAQGMRAEGVYLDKDQARVLLTLAQDGAAVYPHATEEEADVLRRFEKRCEELKP